MNTQNYSYSQSQNIPQPTSISVNLNDQSRSSQGKSENYPFFQQNENHTNRYHTRNQPPFYTANYFTRNTQKLTQHLKLMLEKKIHHYIYF